MKGFFVKVWDLSPSEHLSEDSVAIKVRVVRHLQALGVGQGPPFYSHIEQHFEAVTEIQKEDLMEPEKLLVHNYEDFVERVMVGGA